MLDWPTVEEFSLWWKVEGDTYSYDLSGKTLQEIKDYMKIVAKKRCKACGVLLGVHPYMITAKLKPVVIEKVDSQ